MSLVDRVNERFVAWLRRTPIPYVLGDDIVMGHLRLALVNATDIVALEAAAFPGGVLCLLLAFPGDRLVSVDQQNACWNDLLAALDRLKLTELPSTEWTVQLLSSAGTAPVLLRQRSVKT